ncbi:ribonuclease P 40kDa subunit-domain-containing protein [Immersiella caudata]|uniref:Ribonuclease P 40kDa subunit-domain-containing protein n=1 Tax=Immersiella caudata TaxID=314043 RepID=A0AA39WR07_9PEZI|nr:ribonuclease P 40kDa subunit-domain-containing protein [Immersiella caudata]
MLSFQAPSVYQASKCYFTYGKMGHTDPRQPPSKSKPWTTVIGQDFVHRVDVIVPKEGYEAIWAALVKDRDAPKFEKVVMSLQDVLSGYFFTEYIKKGNIMMLSEGRIGIDNVFCLKDGVLTMYLDKETYERAGLVGKPHGVKGARGLKPRWVVEFALKGDSMSPGKKGFGRLVAASKNALSAPVTWLFSNLSDTDPVPDPLLQHAPTNHFAAPEISWKIETTVPPLQPTAKLMDSHSREDLECFSTELYEWLSLVRLESPRINHKDDIDPFLCRYRTPGSGDLTEIYKISWQGYLSSKWCRDTLVHLMANIPTKSSWFSFSTTSFSKAVAGDNAECTILRPPTSTGEYLMWEVKSHE